MPDGLKSLNGTNVWPSAIGGNGGNVRRGSGAGPVAIVAGRESGGAYVPVGTACFSSSTFGHHRTRVHGFLCLESQWGILYLSCRLITDPLNKTLR